MSDQHILPVGTVGAVDNGAKLSGQEAAERFASTPLRDGTGSDLSVASGG